MGLRSSYRLLGALRSRRVAAPSPPPDTCGEDLFFGMSEGSGRDAVGSKADEDHDAVSEQGSTNCSGGGDSTDGLSSLGSHDASAEDVVGSRTPPQDIEGADPDDQCGLTDADLDDGSRQPDDFAAEDPMIRTTWNDQCFDSDDDSICSADLALLETYGLPSFGDVNDEELYDESALGYGREYYQATSDFYIRWKLQRSDKRRLPRRVGTALPPGALVGSAPRSPRPDGSFDISTGEEQVQEAWKKCVRMYAGGSIAYSFWDFDGGGILL
jgi:hypothetical protein